MNKNFPKTCYKIVNLFFSLCGILISPGVEYPNRKASSPLGRKEEVAMEGKRVSRSDVLEQAKVRRGGNAGWIAALEAVMADPEYQADVTDTLLARVSPVLGADMDAFMDSDYAWIQPLMEELNLTA